MKMKYMNPEIKIKLFEAEDIITASGEEVTDAAVFKAAGYTETTKGAYVNVQSVLSLQQ